jgi:hypothetical protein
LRAHYHTLNIIGVTTLNNRLMAEVIRAGMFSRLKTVECSGTDLSSAPEMFEQIALLLENGRRYAISPITKFLLSSIGLGEPHFRRILEAVQDMPRPMDPTGPWTQHPDVAEEDLEMRLELLNVSVIQTTIRDPLHQVDRGLFGIVFWDRFHSCLHLNIAANIDRAAADECCHRHLARPP